MLVFNPTVYSHTKWIVRIVALLLPLVFLVPLLAQTVFAQTTTYTVTDGEETVVYSSNETDPAEVLQELGIVLGAEDTFTTTETGDGVSEILVLRNQNISINYCGKMVKVTSYGETVESLLQRNGLTAAYGDNVVSEPLNTMTYDGMEITVDNLLKVEQTYTQEIPYEVSYCYDPTMPEGEEKLLVAGKSGQTSITASVIYKNFEEQSRTVLSETVLEPVVNEIILVGTGEKIGQEGTVAIGDGVIVTATGEILTYSRTDTFKTTAYTHTDAGCDMITATGTTVRIGTVAVDPTVIPYGTRMFIAANDGSYIYGLATAEDCGGGVKGNHIDLYLPTTPECFAYGVKTATVYFLN